MQSVWYNISKADIILACIPMPVRFFLTYMFGNTHGQLYHYAALRLWYHISISASTPKEMNPLYLKIIRGGIGAGKSWRSYSLIQAAKEKNPALNMVMVVPDQFSFTAEKAMTERFSGTGPNGIEVLTFSRLTHRYLGKRAKNYMTAAGKRMLVYKALLAAGTGDSPFAGSLDKPGFLGAAADILEEFTRYMVTPAMLTRQAESCTNDILARKLQALGAIYAEFLALTQERFWDSENDPRVLADKILSGDDFQNTCFFFDEFSDFLPQHYLVLAALIQKSRGVCVTLTIPRNPDKQLYKTPLATLGKLEGIARDFGATYIVEQLPDGCRFMRSPEMQHLAENWGAWEEQKKYRQPTTDVHLFQARDIYAEVENAAAQILALIREQNYRFRDISLICGDTQAYAHVVEAVFRDAGIPYYTDLTQAVTDHPIITLAMSVFDIQRENWSYDAVFRYIRTGFLYERNGQGAFLPFPQEDGDILENYVLKRGIRGKKMWFSQWEEAPAGVFGEVLDDKKYTEEDMEQLNQIRSAIIGPFAAYLKKTAGRRTVREIASAFFDFLTDIHLYEGLQTEVRHLREAGFANEAGQFALVWNMLVEIVEQAVVTMGDEKCGKEDFAAFLRAGLSQCAIRIIPSGVDSVFVGSAERSRQPHVRAIFALGAVHGSMPKELSGEGLLSDADRASLADSLPLGEDTKDRREAGEYRLFRLLTAASDGLYVSYPAADVEGTAQRPAQFVWSLMRLFPKLDIADDIITDYPVSRPASAKAAFDLLVRRIAAGKDDGGLLLWFSKSPAWQDKLQILEQARSYRNMQPKIQPQEARELYGETGTYSVSRLNEFGRCPFGYFLKYGLRAREQEVWQTQKFELGSLMHWAVCEYCRVVEDGAKDFTELKSKWRSLTDERSGQIISSVMQAAESRIVSKLKRDQEKVRYLIMRTTKTLKRSSDVIRKSIASGDYAAVCYEQDFRIHIRWGADSVRVIGTIDRIDLAEDTARSVADVRVVDYKSGRKDFDVVSICNWQDMQLVVYAVAALELYQTGALRFARKDYQPRVGGVLYNKLRDDIKQVPVGTADAAAEAAKDMKADGLVVLDTAEGQYLPDGIYRTDRSLLQEGVDESGFIKLKLKKDGLPDAYSKVASQEDFNTLMNYVKKSAVEIDRQIHHGRIDIAPALSDGQKACGFCPYQDICLFDGKGTQGCVNAKEAWEKMRKEAEQ